MSKNYALQYFGVYTVGLVILLRKNYWSCRFIYTFLGLGIFLCLLTCSGHIAAESANGHCLSCVSF